MLCAGFFRDNTKKNANLSRQLQNGNNLGDFTIATDF